VPEQTLRVGLVGPVPPPFGGMANQTRQLAELLRREGIEVELQPVNPPYRPAWIERLRGVRALFRLFPYVHGLWRMSRRVDLVHVMANSGWSWHLFAAPAVWIPSLRGVPVVVNYRGGEADAFFERSFRVVRPTLQRASAVVVPSGFLREVFECRGIEPRVVPNIVNLERFSPSHRTASSGMDWHIVIARNLEPIYGIDIAIRAFAIIRQQVPGARMSIAGSGPELQRLSRLVTELGLNEAVHFTGRLENERMAELYRDADLMLNSSLVDNMPISLLEALASGLPIVSTDAGGIPHLVEHGRTALLVPIGDATAMAEAAIRVFKDRELAENMRAAGLETVKQYAWNTVRRKWLDVYGELLGRALQPADSRASE
jgi:glycosyltransferase involved in cell wall biosynthesis